MEEERYISICGDSMRVGLLWSKIKTQKSVECYGEDGTYDRILEKRIPQKSRKALSSHRRVRSSIGEDDTPTHSVNPSLMELKSHFQLKNLTVDQEHNRDVSDGFRNNVCLICGKKFPSIKSLSGHLRCHPDRGWRGIQPPLSIAKYSLSSTVTDSLDRKTDDQIDSATTTEGSASDHVRSMSSWAMTRKRSWRIESVVHQSVECLQDPISDAVHNLMMLAHADPPDSSPSKKNQRDDELEAKDIDFTLKKAKIYEGDDILENGSESESIYMDSRLKKMVGVGDSKQEIEQSQGENVNYNKLEYQINCVNEKISQKKKKKKRKMRDLKSVADGRHVCSTCNKSFSSHQALGGHRSSHKKFKNGLPTAESDELTVKDAVDQEASLKLLIKHKCNICSKVFPTGQALGGHKRRHWAGPVEDPMSSITLQEDVPKTRRPLLDFDLNELPDPAQCQGRP
ncbi:zinc finger protein ZAT9-like [Magnolia sinica]|uniref:zinc finger protein ZAT9-like n=1 Tax=Magnolia sinica TaxID=86752 RepID=UPI002659232E|nr:zinc finger protein ZAT9-like [Magnolia sinica]